MTRDQDDEAMPARLAAMLLRAARAHAKLSQRELAGRAGVAASTVGRAETGVAPPSWSVMVRLIQAAGCALRLTSPDGTPIEPWEFDAVRDRGGRHLPAHLEVWKVEPRGRWWGWLRYSTWADPPTPTHTYEMRSRYGDVDDGETW